MGYTGHLPDILHARYAGGAAFGLRALSLSKSTLIFLGVLSLALSACTNRKATTSTSTQSDLNKITSTSSNSYFMTIQKVMKNATAPSSNFDITGDQTGAMGTYCTSTASGSADPNTGPSTCVCNFSYTHPTTGATESFEAPTLYHESDLIRCTYSLVPAGTTSVKVKIRLTTTDQSSNTVTFTFGTSSTNQPVDSRDILNFAQVERYQCRRIIQVPYLFDPTSLNDPIQSEDRSLAETLNFYTTNMGATLSYYAGGVGGGTPPYGWYCPPNPRDTSATSEFDLNIYSIGADAAGSKRIYPSTGSTFDRSTFLIAKKPTGVFTVPVNAYIAPFTATSAAEGSAPPIGYGAAPVPSSVSAGVESCPDAATAQIPDGYQFVKLWLFRMSMPVKRYARSDAFYSFNEVACTPGHFNGVPNAHLFPDCFSNNNTTGSVYWSQLTPYGALPADTLVSRFLTGTAMCMNLDPIQVKIPDATRIAGPGYTTDTASGTLFGTYAGLGVAPGSDVWFPNGSSTTYRCGSASALDPGHVCDPRHTPYDNNFHFADLTPYNRSGFADSNQRYYDFVFVVSPTSVMSGEMSNRNSATAQKYTPFRFNTKGDCAETNLDPDNPTSPGDCSASNALRNYGMKLHDVGSAGDPPADDPNRAGTFPMCVLQKKP